jgi:arabinose-5-phosphate isomerase
MTASDASPTAPGPDHADAMRERTVAERRFLAAALDAEAEALRRLITRIEGPDGEAWHRALDLLEGCRGHVVVSGMGKSGLVGAKLSATLASLGQPSHVVHPAEAVHGDLGRIRRDDVVLLLSFSGETDEVVSLASILRADEVARIGISSRAGSSLARLSTVHLDLGDIVEACPLRLAPTASTTAMMAAGDALALALARRRDFAADDFHKHHPGGMLGANLRPIVEVIRFRVGENLPVIHHGTSVRETLASANSGRRAGAVVLVDDAGRLSGIFTDGDLRRLVHGGDLAALDRPIAERMTREPQRLTVDQLVRDAVQLIRERRLDEIPVVDRDGRPVGLVDVQDLIAMRVVRD